jgi:TPP-dependent pyruvate/acetoin dehydrogenase alpha subunit
MGERRDAVTEPQRDNQKTADVPAAQPTPEALREWLQTMLTIRRFENESVRLSFAGKIPGGIHSSEGQEGVAVGSIRALGPADVVSGTHRSHHHALAKGMALRQVMAELYGRVGGSSAGRGGSMHLVDRSLNFLGSNGIVGAGLGIAMGASLAMHMQKLPSVAIGFFGDGGANNGRVWESINLAALWKLPLIAICENNLYAVETHISQAMAGDSVASRAVGFGLNAVTVDGQDVIAMYDATRSARDRALAGGGPTFIEAQTYRYEGHNVGDVQNYREKDEVAQWRAQRDPIDRLRRRMTDAGMLGEAEYAELAADAEARVADAIAYADSSPWPSGVDAATTFPSETTQGVA